MELGNGFLMVLGTGYLMKIQYLRAVEVNSGVSGVVMGGGELAGNLHGHKPARLAKKFRLVFSIDDKNKTVYLEAIDHRKDIY